MANFINCLSILEKDTALLYKKLSNRVDAPLLKSLLLSISEDSLKHSSLSKGVADSITKTPEKPSNCEKNTGEVWVLAANLNKEIDAKGTLSGEDMSQLSQKLVFLESIMGEEYYIFVQMKTLEIITKEINQIYSIDLGSLKSIFVNIINDEEHHREILEAIKNIIEQNKKSDNNPLVKYTNPDSWVSPFTETQ